MQQHFPAILRLHQLTLAARLGYGEQERLQPQPVILDISLYFGQLPRACSHDGEGFLCYDSLTQQLKAALEHKEFQLIEYLAPYLGKQVATWLDKHKAATEVENIYFTLTLLKNEAPVPELRGGASFTYTTLPRSSLCG